MIQSKANNISTFSLSKVAMVMLLVAFALGGFAQGWEKNFGGNAEDQGFSIIQTNDYGFLVVGWSESFGEDNDPDVYAVRTDVDGTLLWDNIYDEGLSEVAYAVIETDDHGFLIAGEIVNEVGHEAIIYLLKITEDGKKEWSRSYGDTLVSAEAHALCQLPDGGFALTGKIKAENGEDDIIVMRVDAQGEEIWTKTFGGDKDDTGNGIVCLEDGIAIVGSIKDEVGADSDIYVSRLDLDGNIVWADTTLQTNEGEEGNDLILTQSGELVIAGSVENFQKACLAKYSLDGDEIWFKWIDHEIDDAFYAVIEDQNEDLVAVGITVPNGAALDILMGKFDKNGNQIWLKSIGEDGQNSDFGTDVAPRLDGGYVIAGYNSVGLLAFHDVSLIKTDGNGNTLTNYINGRVYTDEGNCDNFDAGTDLPLEDWLVIAKGTTRSFLGSTDENGMFNIRVDTGSYEVNVLPVNEYWTNCFEEEGYHIEIEEFYDTTFQINFPIVKEIDCPYLEVDISAEFLTICSDIDYTVAYCNLGTGSAEGAFVDLVVDEDLTVNDASLPFTQIGDGLYRFDLGTINSTECGSFVLNAALPCEGIATGQAGLVSAHIFPDTLCTQPGPGWDGSSIIALGTCDDNEKITFEIKNVGDGDMQEPLQAFIVEDDVIVFLQDFELEADSSDTFERDATGSTYRLVAEQSVDHPGMGFPTVVVEGCSEDGNYNTGFVTQFPENDQDPFIAIDVQEAMDINSELPQVDLRGYPKGYNGNEIVANTDLTYVISFENTGTDTINRIVIRDTIPEELDIENVIPGSSSHPYDFEIYENGILKFTFNEIQLQPSGSAEATNRGFVKFRIAQKPDLSVGTIIKNSAAVFFDYHDPLVTPVVEHQIGCAGYFPVEDPDDCYTVEIVTDVDPGPENSDGVKIKVYPNPFFESATIEIEGELYDEEVTFELYDLYGQLIRRNYFKGQHIMVYRNHLPSGMYIYKLESKGQHIQSGRLVVR